MKINLSPAVIRNEQRRLYLDALAKADMGYLEPFVRFAGKSLGYTQKTILENL